MLTIGSLFSGYGGLDMGVSQVIPSRTAWFCEYEKEPSMILKHHWPDVPNLGDITAVDWSQVEPVDIITGGSPCQDLSHAGARKGMTDGTRSNLWVQMRECIATIRPRYVVWENVRGALSASADSDVEPCTGCVGDGTDVNLRALGRVLGDLADLGFDAQWHGLRAADVGAPHGRFRVFVVAHTRGGQLARTAICRDGLCIAGEHGVRPTTDAAGDGWDEGSTHGCGSATGSSARPKSGSRDGGCTATDTNSLAASEQSVCESGCGDTAIALCGDEITTDTDWGQYGPAIHRWQSILGRTAPAPTEPGPRGGQRLSPRFVEFMMGLPDGHVTDVPGISRNAQLKALGNGVVPQQAAAAVRLMLPAAARAAA